MNRPEVNGESAAFMAMNRNKRGIALNLKLPAARDALKRMIAQSDVVTENYRQGTMEKLGLGYEALTSINPALIYCSISGYGRSGPYAEKGGFDLIAQGASGLMAITGEPGGAPVKAGSPICDINAGILGALGIVSAYVHRLKTGEGQLVDTSLFEAGIQQTYWQSAIYFATGHSPEPSGSAHILSAPYQAFHAKDGWLTIGGANQPNWERLAGVLGASEWLADERFRTNADRMNHLEALVPLMNAKLEHKTVKEWIALLEAEGVPCGPIYTMDQVFEDPQVRHLEAAAIVRHPRLGDVRIVNQAVKLTRTPASMACATPELGEHTDEILQEVGYRAADLARLRKEKVI
jgi:crotonobetainyl-CoA:carnitine CoA-transferase CaiB-like acyl-CoA transferase